MIDPIVVGFTTTVLISVIAFAIHKSFTRELEKKLGAQVEITNAAEKNIHLKELEFLAERNKSQLTHAEAIDQARALAYDAGKKQAKSEHELNISMRLSEQRSELNTMRQAELEQATTEAKNRLRAEYELQTKLFSIKISPYVQLLTDNGIFKNTHEAKLGYQYQLLVNGIPAFQPHVFVESHEKIEQIDQQVRDRLLATAQMCAEAAVTTYLGASSQFAKLAPGVINQATK